MKHKHHIVPKHMGGSDDPSNLIELTPEEHSEAHRLLYEQHGKIEDYLAWKGLSGLIGKDDIIKKLYEDMSGPGNSMYGTPCYYKMTDIEKQRWKDNISKALKGRVFTEEHKAKIGRSGKDNARYGKDPWNKGKTGLQSHSEEHKRKISKPIIYRGKEYFGITEAAKLNNTTPYYILKEAIYK